MVQIEENKKSSQHVKNVLLIVEDNLSGVFPNM